MTNIIHSKRKTASFPAAIFLSALLTLPLLTSCGGGSKTAAPPPPVDNTVGRTVNNPEPANQTKPKKGLNTGQKVAITLAGAAALYYLYNRHKNKEKEGAQGKYYLSKNGRVYFRDAQGRPQWVSPPSGGIKAEVPESEAQQYRDFQGYNGSTTGRTLKDVAPASAPY